MIICISLQCIHTHPSKTDSCRIKNDTLVEGLDTLSIGQGCADVDEMVENY